MRIIPLGHREGVSERLSGLTQLASGSRSSTSNEGLDRKLNLDPALVTQETASPGTPEETLGEKHKESER